jgi:hypothetical protein
MAGMTIDLSVVNAKTPSRKDAKKPSDLSQSNADVAGELDAMEKPVKIGDYGKIRSIMPGITPFYGISRFFEITARGAGIQRQRNEQQGNGD